MTWVKRDESKNFYTGPSLKEVIDTFSSDMASSSFILILLLLFCCLNGQILLAAFPYELNTEVGNRAKIEKPRLGHFMNCIFILELSRKFRNILQLNNTLYYILY